MRPTPVSGCWDLQQISIWTFFTMIFSRLDFLMLRLFLPNTFHFRTFQDRTFYVRTFNATTFCNTTFFHGTSSTLISETTEKNFLIKLCSKL